MTDTQEQLVYFESSVRAVTPISLWSPSGIDEAMEAGEEKLGEQARELFSDQYEEGVLAGMVENITHQVVMGEMVVDRVIYPGVVVSMGRVVESDWLGE